MEFTQILDELHGVDEIKDSLAILELSQQAKAGEMAPLLDCSTHMVKKVLKDHAAHIREHMPADLRARLQGKEHNTCVRIEKPIPAPVRELALVSCCSVSHQSMPEVSTNGHHKSLEAEALAVIETVKAEPEAAAQPKRRARRTREEMAAVKAQGVISVSIDGTAYEGSAADVALLINALKAA